MSAAPPTVADTSQLAKLLAGRRESALLAFPSVRRMATILAGRCREESWVRTSLASLERFRAINGQADLEAVLQQARREPGLAEEALLRFAARLPPSSASQVSALAMGAKLWLRLNGVPVSWRPLPGGPGPVGLAMGEGPDANKVVLLALIGSGLCLAELLRLRIGSVGALDSEGQLIPEREADPLAVAYTPLRGKPGERLTFLTYPAREALLAHLQQRAAAGHPTGLEAPLVAQSKGTAATRASVAYARRRSQALIRAGSEVNVTLCRATGDFFRAWGLPGSRFSGVEELNPEEFI